MNKGVERILLKNSLDKNKRKQAYKMSSLGEWWIIPPLIGQKRKIKEANKVRYLYLKDINRKIEEMMKIEELEEIGRIGVIAIRILENSVETDYWLYRRGMYSNVI
jgi:hypothetical protein